MLKLIRLIFCVGLIALTSAHGLAADSDPREKLDQVRATLTEIDDELKSPNPSEPQLADLRTRAEQLPGQLQALISDLTPRLDASRQRLSELKPKTKDGADAGPPSDDLKAEQAKFDKLDADLRSARASLLEANDAIRRIVTARRDIFAKHTFARSSSVLSPVLWTMVARETPTDIRSLENLIVGAAQRLSARLSFEQTTAFLAVLAALIASAWPLRWLAGRVVSHDRSPVAGSRFRKAVAAAWTLIVLAALPLAALGIISYALDIFDISDPQLQGVVSALLDGGRVIALAFACSRAVLSPKMPGWRLVDAGDRPAKRLSRLAVGVAILWAVFHLAEALAESVSSYNLLVLTRAIGAVAIPLFAADTFRKLGRSSAAAAAAPGGPADSARPLRTFAWAYVLAVLVCALTGYIALASFLIEHAMRVVGALSALFLLDAIAQEGCEALLKPDARTPKSLSATFGLRRESFEQVVVLGQGSERVIALIAALIVAIGPFGMPSQDLVASLRTAYFGFTIGGVTLSISSLVGALVLFFLILAASRAGVSWLGDRYLPRTRLDAGVKNSIRTIVGYIGWVAALIAGGAQLGVDAERLALIAGGLSVGIGFGLQGIANNFISGLILLWERGIRVGDWVVVGTDQGFVRRINARATEIETFERATLIVPNLTLVTGAVKNWMHTDRVARIVIPVAVAYENDPEEVRALLIDAAKAQDAVLSIPAPLALFSEFGDWAMKFQLICYVEDAVLAERVKSELNFDIVRRIRLAGLRIPYPFPVGNTEAERGPNTSRTPAVGN